VRAGQITLHQAESRSSQPSELRKLVESGGGVQLAAV
jgi:hypothetical protein